MHDWLKMKELEFSIKESINPIIDAERWLQRYIYFEIHEIFCVDFPIILVEWLLKLCEKNECFKDVEPKFWTPELVQYKYVSNKVSDTIDFWLDSVLSGYVTEFVVDYENSYSVEEVLEYI